MRTPRLIKHLFIVILFHAIGSYANAQSASEFKNLRKEEIEEIQKVEKINYDKACKIGTPKAYNDYLNMYEALDFISMEHIITIKERIKDYDIWSIAKKTNTTDGYKSYLTNSKLKAHTTEAKEALEELKSIELWNEIRLSSNRSSIDKFIADYPNSSKRNEAQNRRHELIALDYYNNGDLENAYISFSKIDGRYPLSNESLIYYGKAEEYYKYKLLTDSSQENNLKQYLVSYPNSKYYKSVSNMLAVCKAKKLTAKSKRSERRAALKYATDKETKKIVRSYIKLAKKSR